MTNFKGTKGKWVFDDTDIFSLNREESKPVEFIAVNGMAYSSNSNWEANALLISKAPEMLDMLEKLYPIFRELNVGPLANEIEKLIKEATEL